MRKASVILSALAVLAGLSCGTGDTIRIGLVLPITGEVKTFGESARNGAMQAFEEVNVAGGINGRQVQAFIRDDANNPARAVQAAAELIQNEGVVALLGSISSENTIALAEECQEFGVPLVVPTATNPKVTVDENGRRRGYVFRACFIDPFQGRVAAKFAHDSLRLRRAVVICAEGDNYSTGLAEFFSQSFEARGGKVLASVPYVPGTEDFTALLADVREQNPDLIFLPGYYSTVGIIARQAREAGITAQLLGGDGWDSPKMPRIAGEAIEGGYFTNHFSADDPRPRVQTWVSKYQAKYGRSPDALATLAYDAALILVEALKAQPAPTREGTRDALARVRDFSCVSGRVTFDENGNPIKSAVVLQYTATGQKYIATIEP